MELLSQVAEPMIPPWVSVLMGNVGGAAFAFWFAYYMVTKLLPQMQRDAREDLAKIIHDFRADQARLVNDFRADQRHMADQRYQGDVILAKALDDIRETILQGFTREDKREKARAGQLPE